MGRLGYCVPCGERRQDVDATVVIDGDPMCSPCARFVGAVDIIKQPDLPLAEERQCSRGCGKAPHRGNCAGRERPLKRLTTPVPSTTTATADTAPDAAENPKQERYMDTLNAEEIDIKELPAEALLMRPPTGRMGELWKRFRALEPRRALKVACRDRVHVGSTDRGLREKAQKAGIRLMSRRVESTLYCWKP